MTLEAKRDAAIKKQQALRDAAKAESRGFTAEEQKRFNELQTEIDSLNAQIRARDNGGEPAPQPEPTSTEPTEGERQAIQNERARVTEITAICRSFGEIEGIDPDTFINNGSSVDQVRAAVLAALERQHNPVATGGGVEVTDDENRKFRSAAADALLIRSGMEISTVADGARDLVGASLKDMAAECLKRDGNAASDLHLKSADEIFSLVTERAYFNPTAAFPAMLDNAIEKAYVEGHKKVSVTFDRWTKKGTLKDFKTHDNNYLAGPVGEFLEVPEGGELKATTFKDAKLPTRKLKTYGRQFSLTRQAFINDDIDAITRLPARFAAAGRKTINKQCYEILVKNPKIYDGVKLFDKAHKNIIKTGTGITSNAMQGMIMAIANQLDQFGDAILIRPAIIIVPSGYMFDMYTLFFSPTINTSENTQAANPLYQYREKVEVVEDPTINVLCGGFGTVMPWYLLGSKDDTDFMEVDYLNGQEIPTIRRMETSGQLGFVYDVYHDWGVSVQDFRGAVMNPGIQIDSPVELA